MGSERGPLQFTAVSSFIQPGFWNKLSELKIEVDKLRETDRKIWGYFPNVPATWPCSLVEVDSTSFNSEFSGQENCIAFHGRIYNKNTIEQFKECDKTELINSEGLKFLEQLKQGAILKDPSMLNFFFILSFSDLKKYHFYYWFAFPVPHNLEIDCCDSVVITSKFSDEQLAGLTRDYLMLDLNQRSYFLVHDSKILTLTAKLTEINEDCYSDYYFAFADFKCGQTFPKSQLKNYVVFIMHHCPFLAGKTVNFLWWSLGKRFSCSGSTIWTLTLPQTCPSTCDNAGGVWVGWEKNEKDKLGPRFSNMKRSMDPEILFEESVDLNLKLMKWRLLPDVDLEKVKKTNFLLLGAGTLGCSVARTLLGWGVRNITFVDNATVSFSNPVRQSLFTYEDSILNKLKAEAAADNLKKIFPSINSQWHTITIPMPGHNFGAESAESVSKAVTQLESLIRENDVIFLLTDSRESRWLPTLLGTSNNKIIINVALGFDTYLVMRYGGKDDGEDQIRDAPAGFKAISGKQLGCYFCSDVTAPGNSLKDRTLDQQCTVTRPGVSPIAGGLAVELAISLLHHREGIDAPAFYKLGGGGDLDCDSEANQSILGVLPHSIRGFLANFSHVLPATPRYDCCIACSASVLNEYEAKGFDFLSQAFHSSKYLEDLTGLTKLQDANAFGDVLEVSDNEDWEG